MSKKTIVMSLAIALILIAAGIFVIYLRQRNAAPEAVNLNPNSVCAQNLNCINNDADTITVDSNQTISAADNHLQGMLGGVTYDSKKDYSKPIELLSGLRPAYWRLGSYSNNVYGFVVDRAQFPQTLGTKIIFNVQENFIVKYGFYTQLGNCNSAKGSCFNNYDDFKNAWSDNTQDFINQVKAQKTKIDYYDIFTEPGTYKEGGLIGLSEQQLFEFLKIAHDIIRKNIPDAKITAPSTLSFFPQVFSDMFDYMAKNNIKLDAVSWHEFDPNYPEDVLTHVAAVNKMMAEKLHCGSDCPKIHINEYSYPSVTLIPGYMVGYLYYFTKAGVSESSRACWDVKQGSSYWADCWQGFGGLLTKDGTQPQSIYWVYKAYADMSGDILNSDSSSPRTIGLASLDKSAGKMKIIIGKYDADSDLKISIKDYPFANENVKITLEKIPNNDNKVTILNAPMKIYSQNATITSSELDLGISNLVTGDAYVLDINKN